MQRIVGRGGRRSWEREKGENNSLKYKKFKFSLLGPKMH